MAGTAMVGLGRSLSGAPLDLASAQRTLAEHRIAKIETKRSNDRYSHFVGRGARGGPTRFGFGREVRILVTDQGARGGAMSGAKREDIAALTGLSVSDLYDMETGTFDHAMSIDLPLHDLVGNILGQPVYRLLGAQGPTHVPIYSSSIHFEDLEPWGKAEGIPRLLRECQVDYRRLRDHMSKVNCESMIMEGEMRSEAAEQAWKYGWYSRRHVERLFALAEEGLIDVINMDLAIVGYSRWRRAMPELAEAGILASPHTWAGTPRPYYCAHLAAGVGNCDIVEGIPGKATGMDYSAYRFENGNLILPDSTGFGIELSL